MNAHVALAHEAFDAAEELRQFTVALADEGAIVSFVGRMRPTDADGSALSALVLEHYRGATLASIEAIVREAHERFLITASRTVHRVGAVAPGQGIVFVATAAAHRRAAFEAADFLMDQLKTRAVLWKREESGTGRRWVEPAASDHDDQARWDKR